MRNFRYLREQLDSLYAQTLVPDEIFVSDDHSTDETVKILEDYHKRYGLRYIVNEKGLGVNGNFEQAIRSCTGDYVMICDQDDVWFPQKVEVTYKKMKEIEGCKPAIVSSQCYDIDSKGLVISKRIKISKDSFSCSDTLLQPANVTQGCSMMMNKKLLNILKTIPSSKICLYDAYIGFVCASIGIKYNIAAPLMYYRHHNSNVIARFSSEGNHNIKGRVVNLINKYQLLPIPEERYHICVLIKNEYGNFFTEEAKNVYMQLDNYFRNKSKLHRLICTIGMKELSVLKRIRLIIGIIISK